MTTLDGSFLFMPSVPAGNGALKGFSTTACTGVPMMGLQASESTDQLVSQVLHHPGREPGGWRNGAKGSGVEASLYAVLMGG